MFEPHAFPLDLGRRTRLDYLHFVMERIHTVVVATVRGKGPYHRLAERRHLALVGMVGASTIMEPAAISAAGDARKEEPQLPPRLFARDQRGTHACGW